MDELDSNNADSYMQCGFSTFNIVYMKMLCNGIYRNEQKWSLVL